MSGFFFLLSATLGGSSGLLHLSGRGGRLGENLKRKNCKSKGRKYQNNKANKQTETDLNPKNHSFDSIVKAAAIGDGKN